MTSEHFKMLLNLRNDESESIASSNPLNVLSTEEKDEKNKKITNIKKKSVTRNTQKHVVYLGLLFIMFSLLLPFNRTREKSTCKNKEKDSLFEWEMERERDEQT